MSKNFSRINFHNETVERFKNFALDKNENYTETIEVMLDFFEKNQINPFVPFDNSVNSLTILINKRMDAVESILREIEKRDLIPTRKMLESLFVKPKPTQPRLVEKKFIMVQTDKKFERETKVPKFQYDLLEGNMNLLKNDLRYILDKVKIVKSTFGKDYLKLELTEAELLKFRRRIDIKF